MSKDKSNQILKRIENLYQKGDFESAKNEVLKSKSHLDSGLFHYNLGSLYLKMGKIGPARLQLEKAKVKGFNFPMLWKNLNYVNGQPQVQDPTKSKDLKEFFIGKTLDIPISSFILFSTVVFILILFFLRRKTLNIVSFLTLFILLSLLPLGFKYYLDHSLDYAIALVPTRVYEGPSKIYPDYGELGEGSRVILSKYHDNWFFITSPQDYMGWVEKDKLGFY